MMANTARDDRILTLHPAGKQGVRIDRRLYESMRRAILKATPKREPGVLFSELRSTVPEHLAKGTFENGESIGWYVTTVKLDLEARGEIERVANTSPQRLVRRVSPR